MSRPAPATAGLRRRMVREQIAHRGVRDPRVLLAMDRTPREWFVPDESSADAYADEPLPLLAGQTISQPYVVALMTSLLSPTRHDRVLEIGTGSGYQTAILARLAAEIYTVERIPELLVTAEARLARMGCTNIQSLIADGARGWSAAAPFDGILVAAAAPRPPAPLLEQLAPGGRLVIPIGDRAQQELMVFTRGPSGIESRGAGGVRFVPLVSPLSFEPGAARVSVDLLGAHVSTDGGVSTGPARGAEVGAVAIQLFTKTPNQWREPPIIPDEVDRFKAEMARHRIAVAVAHDSYLINLASPDDKLRAKSLKCFKGELERCRAYGIPYVVSHPGNFMDEHDAGLARNAEAYATALAEVAGDVGVLIEGTAGAGTALGRSFEELRDLRNGMPESVRHRVGFCLDTAHLHAAGYDVVGNVSGVFDQFDRIVGLSLLKCFHLNDSKAAPGSRLDRHEWIGEGTIGAEPFRRILQDARFTKVIKIIETPKGDDPVKYDRRMLERLRSYV